MLLGGIIIKNLKRGKKSVTYVSFWGLCLLFFGECKLNCVKLQ